MKKLELYGKRWFQRSFGNTYFSAVAKLNGDTMASIEFKYGYGEHWLDCILQLISKVSDIHGLPDRGSLQPWQYIKLLEEKGFAVFTSVQDVNRKKDL